MMPAINSEYIFIVFTNFGLGGIQRKIVDIVNELANDPNIYPVLIFKDKKIFNFESRIKNPRTRFFYAKTLLLNNKYFNFFSFSFTALSLFFTYKPKSILAFHHYSLMAVGCTKFFSFIHKSKIVLSQDNILSLYNNKEYTGFALPLMLMKWLYFLADIILVQTRYAKNDLIKTLQVSAEKVKVISNWVLAENTHQKKKRSIDVVYVGRFERQKNLGHFLYVVTEILKKKDIKVVIMGDGSEKKELAKKVKKIGRKEITLLAPQSNVETVLKDSKIFLLTSKFEGMPMALLEAMAQGVVPFVLNSPGVTEYIKHEKTGIVVDSLTELSEQIVKYLKNPKKLTQLSIFTKLAARKSFGKSKLLSLTKLLQTY